MKYGKVSLLDVKIQHESSSEMGRWN